KTFQRLITSDTSNEIADNSHRSSIFPYDFGVPKSDSGDSDSDIANFDCNLSVPNPNFGVSIFQFSLDNMADNNKTLKELATPDVMYQPWCTQYPKLEKINHMSLSMDKSICFVSFIVLQHLKEFHVVWSTMKPHGILEDYIKMKAFPFSLDEVAKD
ncbi:hypothetical protein CR513_30835, partial [Mucuna pruriens]